MESKQKKDDEMTAELRPIDDVQNNPQAPALLQPPLSAVFDFVGKLALREDKELFFQPKWTSSEIRTVLQQILQDLVTKRPKQCPHCGHEHVHSKGYYRDGRRRWLCLKCHRSFNDFTKTIFASIQKISEMLKYLETDFFQGTALEAAADRLQVDIRTTFAWRHKFATALVYELNKLSGAFISVEDFVQKINLKGSHHKFGQKYKNPKVRIESLNGERFINGFSMSDDGAHFGIQLVSFGERVSDIVGERFLRRCIKARKRVVVPMGSRLAELGMGLKRGRARVECGVREGGAFWQGWKDLAGARDMFNIAQGWGMKFRGVATKYQNNYFATISWITTHFRDPNWLKKVLQIFLSNHDALSKYHQLKNLKLE